jgi:phenylpropionate dioxygenase-like ring-hydroxylating dioxygenase large terminal subunit
VRAFVEEQRELTLLKVSQAWYVACASEDLGRGPIQRTILGTPLVLFRSEGGKPAALLDRCAHRNVPLSLGKTRDARLECLYHGWQYDAEGNCVRVPGLRDDAGKLARAVSTFATREQDGYVWVFATSSLEPSFEPFRLPMLGERYTTIRRVVEVEASLVATLENALDVPHTAFLHRGLFRGAGAPHVITVKVSRTPEGIQAEYVGEPRPEGWAAKILSPSGGVVTHFDRFILPSVAQVEYRLGTEAHFMVTSICTPIEDYRTRIYAAISFRIRLPGRLVRLFLAPVANRIFAQDAFILKAQTDSIRRFGGERYASTAIDVLGLQIARLLRMAESGRISEEGDWSREITMEV